MPITPSTASSSIGLTTHMVQQTVPPAPDTRNSREPSAGSAYPPATHLRKTAPPYLKLPKGPAARDENTRKLCITPIAVSAKSIWNPISGKSEIDDFKSLVNQRALDIQWDCFVNERSKNELKKNLQMALGEMVTSGNDRVQNEAKKFIENKIREEMYEEGDEGAIFSPKGNDLGGPVYRTKATNSHSRANFFLVPKEADEAMQEAVHKQHGVRVTKQNVVGKGGGSTIRIAKKLTETESKFVVFKPISSPVESNMYDRVSPDNKGVLKKEGYCSVRGKRGLFLELAIGDCKKLHAIIKKGEKLTKEETEKIILNLVERYIKIARMLHENDKYAKNENLGYASHLPINHHDIKPNNFLIVERDGIFGIAIADLQNANTEQFGIKTGSIFYAAPEHFDGKADPQKGDIYSLGKTCLDLVDATNTELAKKLREIFLLMVEKKPVKRCALENVQGMLESFADYRLDNEGFSNILKKAFSEN